MPVVIRIFGYKIYFWSNEGKPLEPLHVHVAKRPVPNATKIWLLNNGEVQLEHNNSNIPQHELSRILETVKTYHEIIESEWKKYFGQVDYFS